MCHSTWRGASRKAKTRIGCFQLPFTAESMSDTEFAAFPRFNIDAGAESETWARIVRLWHSFPSHCS